MGASMLAGLRRRRPDSNSFIASNFRSHSPRITTAVSPILSCLRMIAAERFSLPPLLKFCSDWIFSWDRFV
jgi:hypothetical protein